MNSTRSFLIYTQLALIITLALLLITGTAVKAHDDSMPGQGQVPLHARDNMRAFAEEHHHNQNLTAQSITSCVGGFAGTYPCSNVDLMAFLPLAQIGGGNGNDIWGWTDPTTNSEYAIMGLTNGTAFVDITDPVNPVFLGRLPGPNSSWRDIKTYDNHAFIGSEAVNSGMQVINLNQLKFVTQPPVTFTVDFQYPGFSTSHNIVINEDSGYAYAVGTNSGSCSRGLTFVDIVDPVSPQPAGCFGSDGYTHDAQCVNYAGPDPQHQGKEICFAYNEDTLTIVDVTNKAAPVQISRTGYPELGYTHQGWLTDDHTSVLMDDELDERNDANVINTRTLIWDVQDLDNPVYTGDYIGPSTAIDHNQYVVGDYAYQANYTSGLRILDISDIANGNLSEVGFFDIYPDNDLPKFQGAWSVYPFFPSGNIVVSGIEQGLYILRPNNPDTNNNLPHVSIIEPLDGGPALSGTVVIRIHATDTEDAVGSLTVEWNVNGAAWQFATWDGAEYTANWDSTSVLDGLHIINARVIDSGLAQDSDSRNVTVANGTPAFTVNAIVTIVVGRGNRNTGQALVTVTDGGGNPLDGVFIDGTYSGDWSGSHNGTTDGNGQISLKTPKVKNLDYIQFCVDNATKPGWTWDIIGSMICDDSNDGSSAFGTIAGNVTDLMTSSAISGAAVSTETGQFANTDALGDYTLADVPVGNRTVSVSASGFESQNAAANVTENTTTIIDFAMNETATGGTGTIKGTVYSSAGGTIAGATVQVLGGTSSLTSIRGRYNIQNVPAGLQTITASKTGYLSQQHNIPVVAGGNVKQNFTLTPQ